MLATTVSRTEHTCNPAARCWFGADTLARSQASPGESAVCKSGHSPVSECRNSRSYFLRPIGTAVVSPQRVACGFATTTLPHSVGSSVHEETNSLALADLDPLR